MLHARLSDWFDDAARDLPWRLPSRTPWGVLVSEFMLQQTPVSRVLPVWEDWMSRWPTPADLAAEPAGEALRHWGRLGYPRRAVRLHAAATAVVVRHGGQVPGSHDELLALPGVGTYTAAAVAAFAFGRRETVVDTNIRRVHARLVDGAALPAPSLTAAEMNRAATLLPDDAGSSVRWNAAVMELGALVCTARTPACEQCPVLDLCAWVAAGRPAPTYVPRGQSWAGTDRQVRGAIMHVLRHADAPVPRPLIHDRPVDLAFGAPAALEKLHALNAPPEQLERALAGLLTDGLAEETPNGVQLPA
ncbi:A/G-specific DNA-adenine glycosylase [Arthrobacter subterraneus]|uniref:Adenine DNA glycosylase n=1 Tax=Arthrobacter subterraneus TaxID=335973 RepID=A0A1G8IH84_9MICC|nr:A/G-specific adenine glycosylase [Arthrobacter subterraneus]SDI18253.1 A/G-specific DNA-adenine glycosylase [Arthrobacter subterraneus]